MTHHSASPDAGVPDGDVRVRALLPLTRRRSPLTAVVSLLLHALVVLLLVRVGMTVAEERGNPLLDFLGQQPGGGGGGGTGGSGYIALKAPPPPPPEEAPEEVAAPAVVPEVVPPVEQLPELKPEVPPPPDPAAGAAGGSQGSGGGSGGGAGTGEGSGTGSGVGAGSGGGTGGGTGGGGRPGSPPENRGMVLPPLDDIPRKLRGLTFEVTFWVDVGGRVTNLLIEPEISDRKYARRFDEVMRGYRFKPARDGDGRIVAGVATIQVRLPES